MTLSAVLTALLAACAPSARAANGADVSYPQCGSAYPVGQAFGIVGVNGGRATSANPCLASELEWAVGSPGFAAYLYGLAAAADSSIARDWPWWLDVETANSWATYRTSGFTGLNIGALQGFVDGLRAAGALGMIGIYSTPKDWLLITGLSSDMSREVFPSEPDWTGGAANPAPGACQLRDQFQRRAGDARAVPGRSVRHRHPVCLGVGSR